MESNPPPSSHVPEIPSTILQFPVDDLTASSLFDWSDFLDFNVDETFSVSFPQVDPNLSGPVESQREESSNRIRKRDPMLVCPNFLAGQIPCECPELDEQDSALPRKKRARAVKISAGGPTRCQVSGCEVDISELKGYHKRHRVCLQCANASVVVLDGESKRYCQQCGKFHILSDFDEGKRSCRRKLERHNNRRRRRPNDTKGGTEKESQPIILTDDNSGDDDSGKDGLCTSSQIEEKNTLESEGYVPAPCSAVDSQKPQSDGVVSYASSDGVHIDGEKRNPQFKRSPSFCDNKSTFSSVCPAGRISFKLYDWNPAEFPRRLRHQIFQWLASMPVELEGYIRPGCTILTTFIAMPRPTWLKLLEEPALHIKDLVATPENILSGRGTMLVYLNDNVFRVTKDATSVVKVKVKDRAPKLHYIYPTCFEAGRPMEFVACGSDLLQPKFRFLVSCAGRYLTYKISVSSSYCKKGDAKISDHQMLNMYVPQIDIDLCGPAFIEVENQSGLSNFIPVLIGDKETCAEMEILLQKFETALPPHERQLSPPKPECDILASRIDQFSEFVLDVAWSLKKPEHQLTSPHIQRLNNLLTSLLEKESSVILNRVVCSLKSAVDANLIIGVPDADIKLLQKNIDTAQRIILGPKLKENDSALVLALNRSFYSQSFQNGDHSFPNQDMQRMVKNMMGVGKFKTSVVDQGAMVPLLNGEVFPLLNGEVFMNVVGNQRRPVKSCNQTLTSTFFSSRTLIMAIAAFGICFGVCAVVLHPQKIGQIAITIRRCFFNKS